MKKFLNLVFVAVLLGLLLFPVGGFAATEPLEQACAEAPSSPLCKEGQGVGADNPLTGTDGIILKVAGIMAVITGLLAVIMIIVSGIKYITSQGDPAKIKSAHTTIIYAIIGLLVSASAGLIIAFVVDWL